MGWLKSRKYYVKHLEIIARTHQIQRIICRVSRDRRRRKPREANERGNIEGLDYAIPMFGVEPSVSGFGCSLLLELAYDVATSTIT